MNVDNEKPDGLSVPFGHELVIAKPGEPLILIRGNATVPQRLRAAALIANTIANQIEEAEGALYALIFKHDADPVSVHLGSLDEMAEMYDRLSPNWSECYLARIVKGPGDIMRAAVTEQGGK